MFGFGARSIAIIDTAAASPFAQLSMIPLLTLIAYLCAGRPSRDLVRADGLADESGAGRRAVADQVPEPDLYRCSAGNMANSAVLLIVATILSFVLPIGAIVLFGRKV